MRVLLDYQGKPVRLTDERLGHIKEHPEMVNMEVALDETLRRPQLVIRSGMDVSASLNYRYYYGTLVGDKWLCVVVAYGIIDDAFVQPRISRISRKRGNRYGPADKSVV